MSASRLPPLFYLFSVDTAFFVRIWAFSASKATSLHIPHSVQLSERDKKELSALIACRFLL